MFLQTILVRRDNSSVPFSICSRTEFMIKKHYFKENIGMDDDSFGQMLRSMNYILFIFVQFTSMNFRLFPWNCFSLFFPLILHQFMIELCKCLELRLALLKGVERSQFLCEMPCTADYIQWYCIARRFCLLFHFGVCHTARHHLQSSDKIHGICSKYFLAIFFTIKRRHRHYYFYYHHHHQQHET